MRTKRKLQQIHYGFYPFILLNNIKQRTDCFCMEVVQIG